MLHEKAALLQSHCYNWGQKTDRKWCVLSLRLNVETVSQEVRSVGRLFQILGPTNENARRPKEVWTRLGTVSCR